MISNFLKSALVKGNFNYDKWLIDNKCIECMKPLEMEELVNILIKGLEDESTSCTRHTLAGLKIVLNYILESYKAESMIPLLEILPTLGSNPYWLIKVALCELVANISYVTVHYVLDSNKFQNKIVYNLLFEMLKDSDQRVRRAASNSYLTIIPNLYQETFQSKENALTVKAMQYNERYLSNLCDTEKEYNLNQKHFIHNMPFPFKGIMFKNKDHIEFSLSKIILKLYNCVLSTTSKYYISGCIETLSLLSQTYPCTQYRKAWICTNNRSQTEENDINSMEKSSDLLTLCISLMTNSISIYDISFQLNILNLSSNLYAGFAISLLRPVSDTENRTTLWDMFTNKKMSALSELYLDHIIKLLNIFNFVLNDIVPIQPQPKAVLPNLPSTSNLSPLKRRKSDLDKKFISPGKMGDKEEKSGEKKDPTKMNSNASGSIFYSPHYMKIYEGLRSAYTNYKISLESESSEKFIDLLRKTLNTLTIMMEIGTLTEFGRIAEEILNHLRSTFLLESPATVECVQQLLKCLFGTNLTANISEILKESVEDFAQDSVSVEFGFYYNIYQKPYNEISSSINDLNKINKIDYDGDDTIMGYLHRKDIKKPATLSRSSDKILANYIKIFEPMVIKSLKHYTITSDVKLQCRVLQLLNQLVQLRVNYCLLDSEQVFIGFVLKQFDYIEEGQIPFSNELIPKIFQFLVQLSYSKQHSKSIIDVPKIIQLCDGLMASGQSPLTHCIPALEPIVEDIFLTRSKSNTTDMKELETTREVVLAVLLRLSEYNEIIDFITLILEDSKYCTDNTEKWPRWSKQVVAVVFPMLNQNRVLLNNKKSFVSFRKFIFSLNPNAFHPIDDIIIMMFQEPPLEDDGIELLKRWLSKIMILLLILSPIKEEILISKINELKANFSPTSIFENVVTTADPLNVTNSADTFQGVSAEFIFIRFIFRVITLVSKKCNASDCLQNEFLVEQFSIFLMYCLHIFQSGSHCKITNVAISVVNKNNKDNINLDEVNNVFFKLCVNYPNLMFEWCYFLTLLNYNDKSFWSNVLLQNPNSKRKNQCINLEIIRTGSATVFCDYLTENSADSDLTSWILNNNIELLVDICEEPPVFEFISSIHRNPKLSRMIIECITLTCLEYNDLVFKTKILKCVENTHPSQTGTLLNFLLQKMVVSEEMALSRLVCNLASRKIELLLTMSMEDVNDQLKKDDLMKIKDIVIKKNFIKKHETLVSLLNKLATQYYDLSPIEFEQRRVINPEYIKKLQINKNWYVSQTKGRYNNANVGKEIAELLYRLEYNEILDFITDDEFNKLYVKDCIKLGVKYAKSRRMREEPAIIKACTVCLLNSITDIMNKIPTPHQVYNVVTRSPKTQEVSYTTNMTTRFKDDEFLSSLHNIIPSLSCFIESLPLFPNVNIPDCSCEDIVKFAGTCLESINYQIDANVTVDINLISNTVNCIDSIFREYRLYNNLSLDSNISWLCSAVNSLYRLVTYLLLDDEPLPIVPKYSLSVTVENLEILSAGQACYQLYILVSWLYKIKNCDVNIPKYLLSHIKSIIVSLSRLPLANSYILIPTRVWKTGWTPELSGSFHTQVPPPPIDLLQEIDILEEFIFRISLVGWTSRQQFEEIWMCLLSVCNGPVENTEEDINDMVHASSLAIKAITTLLLQTLYHPLPGNPNVSKLIHCPRHLSLNDQRLSIRKLRNIQNNIQYKSEEFPNTWKKYNLINVFDQRNFEKISDKYSYGQMSIRYFLVATKIADDSAANEEAVRIWKERENILEISGLDINSCLQFLLDYYTQLMKPQSKTSLRVLHEAVRSVIIISDLFFEKTQFAWMMDVFLELSKLHAVEDELLHQYLIIGICKSAAVLTPDLETYETIKKILVQYMKSPFLPSRISCLYGLLYILEGCILSNISIGGISDEMQLILPCAVEYVQCNLNTSNNILKNSQDHSLLVWALAFYLIEHIDEIHMETNFVSNTFQTAFTQLNAKENNIVIHNLILKGLERIIILKKHIGGDIRKQILKLAMDKMKSDVPCVAILGTQLLLSYMYSDCSDHLENMQKKNNTQTSPDHLVQAIEKVSAIFERIKKGYIFEVEILCSILPQILDDFFVPSDILTKVIGEFLSAQQPHPKLLSRTVFKVFESAIRKKQLSLLQDWVVFSLSNFTQSFSVGMSTWCLTCFFISASSNEWLRAYFPYVQTRVGRYEYEDRKMLCIAGADFYNNLTNKKQKQTFIDNFTKVKDQADMPFNDLLSSL